MKEAFLLHIQSTMLTSFCNLHLEVCRKETLLILSYFSRNKFHPKRQHPWIFYSFQGRIFWNTYSFFPGFKSCFCKKAQNEGDCTYRILVFKENSMLGSETLILAYAVASLPCIPVKKGDNGSMFWVQPCDLKTVSNSRGFMRWCSQIHFSS